MVSDCLPNSGDGKPRVGVLPGAWSLRSGGMGEFRYEGHRIEYDSYGEGERVLVLVHGLLMNRCMYDRLGPAMARRGNRVICVDLLGHGRSDRPEDLRLYSMPLFARQVVALLDHLELHSAVVGGTSLGANVSLELAVRFPERARALFIEMPVLDNALPAVAAAFTPMLLGLRYGRPAFEGLSRGASLVPRTNYFIDIGLDWVRQRPGPSGAVLEGLLLGETAPHRAERRRIEQPTLIVGHSRDPIHPFTDSGMLAEELPNGRLVQATSILEWRLRPRRLNAALAEFLDEVGDSEAEPLAQPAGPLPAVDGA
jgi:pimeloyl-ACP methyl ester carboxylesterase